MTQMRMIALLGVLALLLLAPAFPGLAQGTPPCLINASVDRATALYTCGETAEFTVKVLAGDQQALKTGTLTVTLTNDGKTVLKTQAFDLAQGNPITLTGTLEKPGFLQCRASITLDGKAYAGLAAAGFEPENITPGAKEPDDFAAFWAAGLAKLEAIPVDAKLVKLDKYCTPSRDCYAVSFANVEGRIYGFLSVPRDRPGPFPAVVTVPGAGVGVSGPDVTYTPRGVITLVMNVFPYDTSGGGQEAQALFQELYQRGGHYFRQGGTEPESYFFYRSILGITRALRWLADYPQCNKRIGVFGSSQGGGMTLVLAGLNKDLVGAVANFPAMCDHYGYLAGRRPGWPNLVAAKGKAYESIAGYYDVANFARRIHCPTRVTAGFVDETCSPSSVYAAYNVIPAPKQIYNQVKMGHNDRPADYPQNINWLIDQLLRNPVEP